MESWTQHMAPFYKPTLLTFLLPNLYYQICLPLKLASSHASWGLIEQDREILAVLYLNCLEDTEETLETLAHVYESMSQRLINYFCRRKTYPYI